MLEDLGVLRTWALASEPRGCQPIAATELADHRLAYLDYEGAISGGRGSVVRWDAGTYDVLEISAAAMRVRLAGTLLRGDVQLTRLEPDPKQWCFQLSG